MKLTLKNLHVSNSQRKLRKLAEWELTRAKGRARFVLRWALLYPLIIIPAMDFSDYLIEGKMQPWSEMFWIKAASYFVTGVIIGYVGWVTMEGKYKTALLERQITNADVNPSRPPNA